MTHEIRSSTFADFRAEVERITEDAVERGLSYAITDIRRADGEWSATVTVEEKANA